MTKRDESDTYPIFMDWEDASDHPELPRGSNLGRYVIIEPIGSGGMGTVYRAYDPQLNRGVALKILSVKHADLQIAKKAKARLIREAQALAQLSHPNVVAVHDAGTFEEDVFIAMELVEGSTLDKWIKEEKRTIKDILTVMTGAGRGLSAAHKAGLVHRDFKPGNVIVGVDGRVRVLDFGLARAAEQEESTDEITRQEQSHKQDDQVDGKEKSSDSSPNLLQSPLTNAGGVLGTPLYMAPEQHLGQKTDERTDQFGFCVVLYEAVYGKRPFAARSLGELKRKVIGERVCIPEVEPDVPAWLWKIVGKGLRAKPADRYANIDALLDDLDKDPEQERYQKRLARRRKLFVIVMILLTIGLPIGVWYGLRYRTFQLCKHAEAEFEQVWDVQFKRSIQKAFLKTGKPFAKGTWVRVKRTLDGYVDDWSQMRSEVCEARLVRGTQSEELFDLRMGCLNKRVRELAALTTVFARADAGVVQKAVQATSSLVGIADCADEESLRAAYPPPKTAEARAKVATIRKKLDQVTALSKTGKYREGLELLRKFEQEATRVDYPPVQAALLSQLGELLYSTGEYKTAETVLYEAALAAGKSRNSRLAARAMSLLLFIVGYVLGRPMDGVLIARDAAVVVELGGSDYTNKARLFNNMGAIFFGQAEFDKALEYYRKALETWKMALGPNHLNLAMPLNNIGAVLNDGLGEHTKALRHHRRALAIRKKFLGPGHPQVAQSLHNLGEVFLELEEYDKSLQNFGDALEIREKALGPGHASVAQSLSGICRVLIAKGKTQEALRLLKKAVAICQKETCSPQTNGSGMFALARALVATRGDKNRAVKLAKLAQKVFRKTPKRFMNELEAVNDWLQKHAGGNLSISAR